MSRTAPLSVHFYSNLVGTLIWGERNCLCGFVYSLLDDLLDPLTHKAFLRRSLSHLASDQKVHTTDP